MRYSNYSFKNMPDIIQILKEKNVFISGTVGTGKTVLLYKFLQQILESDNRNDFTIFIDDDKGVDFKYRTIEGILDKNKFCGKEESKTLIEIIEASIKERALLSPIALEKMNYILVISDEIGCSDDLFDMIKKYYKDSPKLKICFLIAAQMRDFYYRNMDLLNQWKVIHLDGDREIKYDN